VEAPERCREVSATHAKLSGGGRFYSLSQLIIRGVFSFTGDAYWVFLDGLSSELFSTPPFPLLPQDLLLTFKISGQSP